MRGIWTLNTDTNEIQKKLGSLGLSIKHRVAGHGFVLNVCTDLSYFDHIVACGLESASPTSIDAEVKSRGNKLPAS